jgi:Protein of unknown function (DUF1360)
VIPSPWVAAVLALAVFRTVRLAGWDTFPPLVAFRGWLTGREGVAVGSQNDLMGLTGTPAASGHRYRRPALAELLGCAYCSGLWLSGIAYCCWLLEPVWTLYAAAPLALSAAAGTAARWLDP